MIKSERHSDPPETIKARHKALIYASVLFKEFTGKKILEIAERSKKSIQYRKKLEGKIEAFYEWMMNEKALSPNTAYLYVTAVKSKFGDYDINLKLRRVKRGERIPDWIPSLWQLREMFSIGNLEEKTIVAIATNIPMRIGDFLELKKTDVQSLIKAKEFPAFIMKTTKKGRLMPCFITKETARLLSRYIKTLKKNNPYLFQGRDGKSLSEDSINRIVKGLVEKLSVETRGARVRFHMFRKIFIDISRDLVGLSIDQLKILLGKKISGPLVTNYISKELKPAFEKVSDVLNLTAPLETREAKIETLERNFKLLSKIMADLILPKVAEDLSKLQMIAEKEASSNIQNRRLTVDEVEELDLRELSNEELLELYIKLKKVEF